MFSDDHSALFDTEDAMEAKLRLGVFASTLLEGAHILCTDVALLRMERAGPLLQSYAADVQAIGAAIEVLDRRSAPIAVRR